MIELSLRILFSLLVVLGLLWGLARLARRPLARRSGSVLSVVARAQLTRTAAVAVVQVGDRALVLGVTDQSVSLLADADPTAFGIGAADSTGTADSVGELKFPGERREFLSIEELTAAGARRRPPSGFGLHRPGGSSGEREGGGAPSQRWLGALQGSILSPDVWRQLAATVRRGLHR